MRMMMKRTHDLKRLPLLVLGSVAVILCLSGQLIAAPPPGNHMNVFVKTYPLDPSFDPNSPEGGVPFCPSGLLCYPPGFLSKAYNFPPTSGRDALNGRGQTIVLVDAFGSPTIQSDLGNYDAAFGLPPARVEILCGPTWTGAATDVCPVTTIGDLTTAPNAALCGATGWAAESTLDVNMSHAMAPEAKIVLVVANDCQDSNIYAAEQAVVSQHRFEGSIMSQSFGEPDDQVDPTIKPTADAIFHEAIRKHWTVIASSGDSGANEDFLDLGTFELTPSWPATNPLVLAAGGTEGNPYGGQYGPPPVPLSGFTCPAHTRCDTGLVVIDGGANGCVAASAFEPSSCFPVGYGGEQVWNEFNIFGADTTSGGGVSTLYRRPFYQRDLPYEFTTLLGATVPATGRLNPDVSFNASINGGLLSYLGFISPPGWVIFGGTSAASPAWAGIIALVNQANGGPVGFINPAIYSLGEHERHFAFHDITVGNNSLAEGEYGIDGFNAMRGYDLTTGLGTPDVSHLISILAGH